MRHCDRLLREIEDEQIRTDTALCRRCLLLAPVLGVAAVFFTFHTVVKKTLCFSGGYEAFSETVWSPNGADKTYGKSMTYRFAAYLLSA